MRSDYETRAKKFIDMIAPYLIDCDSYFRTMVGVQRFNHDYNRKVSVAHGLTRMALITSDYVVKFDYDERQIARFGGCEDEVAFYQEAEKDGYAYLFAKITPYECNGVTYYIMPRIYGIEKTEHDAWDYMTMDEWDWCTDHELHDLHNGNYGWKNGRIVIIDYGAYDQQALTGRPADLTKT